MLLAVMVVAVFIFITPLVAAQVAIDWTATNLRCRCRCTPESVTPESVTPESVTTVATDPPTPVATDLECQCRCTPESVTPVATNYCNITSCSGRSHVLCDVPGKPTYLYYLNDCVTTGSQSGVPTDDQKVIVDAHNIVRQWVKNGNYSNYGLPAAKTMPNLIWNRELAKVAQEYLNRCRSRQTCLDVPHFKVGRNSIRVHRGSSRNGWENIIIDYFFKQNLRAYPITDLTYKPGQSSKTLFQLIWAKTTQVGCGIRPHGQKHVDHICVYGPGIVEGEMSYEAKP